MSRTAWMVTAAGLAVTGALAGGAAQAQQWSGGYVVPSPYVQQVAPPEARVWVPGHWQWNGYRNEWVNGYYTVQPVYVHPRRIARDEDRDGIPDRYDRDRDGDGVPNRHDRRPDNPWRR